MSQRQILKTLNSPSQSGIVKSDEEKNEFTKFQLKIAATWWAQYLPGIRNVTFDEMYQNIEFNDPTGIFRQFYQSDKKNKIYTSTEEYQDFIEILAGKILTLKIREYNGLRFIEIAKGSYYPPPKIVIESAKEANIQISNEDLHHGTFPFKSSMIIYNNGQIEANGCITCTNPAIVHYNHDINFDRAPTMQISGNLFRIIEIDSDELQNDIFSGRADNLKRFNLDNIKLKSKMIYTALFLRHFKGSEKEFMQFTQSDMIYLLQNPLRLQTLFSSHACIYYESKKTSLLENTWFFNIGEVTTQEIGNLIYQYVTGPVKVLTADRMGTVGCRLLSPVHQGSFLILRKDKNELYHLNSHEPFVARLCDDQGHILSNQIFKPGDILPLVNNQVVNKECDPRTILITEDANSQNNKSKAHLGSANGKIFSLTTMRSSPVISKSIKSNPDLSRDNNQEKKKFCAIL